jgi:choloylglycine hydrolase
MKNSKIFIIILLIIVAMQSTFGCSILYYIDSISGKIYVVNNEDYWYDVDPFVRIEPKSKKNTLIYGIVGINLLKVV